MKNKETRIKILKLRWSLSSKEKNRYDDLIFKKLKEIFSKKIKTKYIGLYWPIENEVDTIKITDWLLKNNYKICIPKIKNKDMKFVEITKINFEYEFWHSMKQPTSNKVINGNEIQLLIVPLIGFNKDNYRMGYGMNFYNNYLKFNKIDTIGLAYSFQKTNDIILTNKDIKLDKIITEE